MSSPWAYLSGLIWWNLSGAWPLLLIWNLSFQDEGHSLKPVIDEYKHEILPDRCKTPSQEIVCEIEPQDPKVSYVVKAVSALTAAFKLLQVLSLGVVKGGLGSLQYLEQRKQVQFLQMHNQGYQGLRQLFLTVSWDLHA